LAFSIEEFMFEFVVSVKSAKETFWLSFYAVWKFNCLKALHLLLSSLS